MALLSLYKIVVRSKPNFKVIAIHEVYEKRVGIVVDEILAENSEVSITITKLNG